MTIELVSGFESLIDQDRPIRILTAFLHKGTLPHALLFTGIEGVGKNRAAVTLAMALNCEASHPESDLSLSRGDGNTKRWFTATPCGSCNPCRKIELDHHPDIIRLKPAGSFIKIDQVRTLCQTLTLKPFEATKRVVIISDAQAMNPAAGNALLKVLEEPPNETIIILIAGHRSDLLPTIASRCQHIWFNPISRSTLTSLLIRDHQLDARDAAMIADKAGGSAIKAQRMHQSGWIVRRYQLIGELDALSNGSLNRILAFAHHLAKSKEDLPEALEILKSWLRDLVIAKLHPDRMRHHDLAADLQHAAQKRSLTSLLSKYDTIESTQTSIRAGTNLRLAMESMVLKLSRE